MLDAVTVSKAKEQAEICRVFANPTRILILWTLIGHEKSVGEIAEAIDASLQTTSQHLRIMKQMNVLTSRRDAQMIFYRVSHGADERMNVICPCLLEVVPPSMTSTEGAA
jgi:ArsR family transcriptional regulator